MAPQKHRAPTRDRVPHALALAVLLLVGFAPLASAGTILHVTGSGSLTVGTTGTLYLDFVQLDATDIRLEAQQEILIGIPFPGGVPGMPTSTIELPDAMGAQSLALLGEVFVDTLDYTGSVTFRGQRIHVSSGLPATNSITLIAGSLLAAGGVITTPDLQTGCGPTAGGVITQGRPGADIGCPVEIITAPPGVIVIGGEIGAVGPVPEPTSALLFAVGGFILVGRKPRH